MKIDELYPSEQIKLNRKSSKMMKIPFRSAAKRILTLLVGGLMCIGSYYYGFESNQNAVKSLEKKVNVIHSSLNELHRAKREVGDPPQIPNLNITIDHLSDQMEVHEPHKVITSTSDKGLHDHDHNHDHMHSHQHIQDQPKGGATYSRWGRRDCPQNISGTSLVYEGIAAGSNYGHTGGGSNVLCLDLNVSYSPGRYKNGNQGASFIFGLEYRDAPWADDLLDLSDIEGGNFRQYDIPCSVCLARGRTNQLMIPGQEMCPTGWTKEYSGYVFGSANTHKHTTDYICLDTKPQIVLGSDGDQGGSLMYIVETQCPSLQCGPYVHGRELACVVCTI